MHLWRERLMQCWWYQAPIAAATWSESLGVILSDGVYLCRWPLVAAFGPLVALLVGIVCGGTHVLSWGETFTFSLLLIGLLFSLASFGSAVSAVT